MGFCTFSPHQDRAPISSERRSWRLSLFSATHHRFSTARLRPKGRFFAHKKRPDMHARQAIEPVAVPKCRVRTPSSESSRVKSYHSGSMRARRRKLSAKTYVPHPSCKKWGNFEQLSAGSNFLKTPHYQAFGRTTSVKVPIERCSYFGHFLSGNKSFPY